MIRSPSPKIAASSPASSPQPTWLSRQYPAAGSKDYFLIFNPSLASNKSFAERVRQQREPNEFAIKGTKLDLIYNELPVGGHGIWPKVYSLPEVYDWLFAHTLAADEKPAAK